MKTPSRLLKLTPKGSALVFQQDEDIQPVAFTDGVGGEAALLPPEARALLAAYDRTRLMREEARLKAVRALELPISEEDEEMVHKSLQNAKRRIERALRKEVRPEQIIVVDLAAVECYLFRTFDFMQNIFYKRDLLAVSEILDKQMSWLLKRYEGRSYTRLIAKLPKPLDGKRSNARIFKPVIYDEETRSLFFVDPFEKRSVEETLSLRGCVMKAPKVPYVPKGTGKAAPRCPDYLTANILVEDYCRRLEATYNLLEFSHSHYVNQYRHTKLPKVQTITSPEELQGNFREFILRELGGKAISALSPLREDPKMASLSAVPSFKILNSHPYASPLLRNQEKPLISSCFQALAHDDVRVALGFDNKGVISFKEHSFYDFLAGSDNACSLTEYAAMEN